MGDQKERVAMQADELCASMMHDTWAVHQPASVYWATSWLVRPSACSHRATARAQKAAYCGNLSRRICALSCAKSSAASP